MALNLCGTVGQNTGPIKCDPKKGRPVTVAIGGKEFSAEEYATAAAFKAAFKAATKLANGTSGKLYGLPEFVGITNKTEANKEGNLGTFGPKVVLIEGKPGYEFDLAIGTVLEKRLRALNGQTIPVFVFDDAKQAWGWLNEDEKLVGYDCVLFCTPKPFEDGATPQVTKFTVSFISAGQFGDDCAYVPTTMSQKDFVGLKDVELVKKSQVDNVGHVSVKIITSQAGNNLNIYDDYKALLTGAGKANWKATLPDGTNGTITSVSGDDTAKDFIVTLDATEWAALSTNDIVTVNLQSPTVLDAANVTGIESTGAVNFVKP